MICLIVAGRPRQRTGEMAHEDEDQGQRDNARAKGQEDRLPRDARDIAVEGGADLRGEDGPAERLEGEARSHPRDPADGYGQQGPVPRRDRRREGLLFRVRERHPGRCHHDVPVVVEGKDELAVAEQERPRVRLDAGLRRLDHVLPPAQVVLHEDPPLAFHVLGELVGLEVQERDDDARHGVPRQGGCGDPADHESGDEEREHDGYDLRSNFHMAPGPHTTTSGLFCHREKNW